MRFQGLVGGITFAPPTPASLDLTGWWSDHTAAPWAGNASAGTSGSNSLTTVQSTDGAALNGHKPASYNGSQLDQSAATADAFFTNTAYTYSVLFKLTVAPPADSPSAVYSNMQLLGMSNNVIMGLSVAASGGGYIVSPWQYDGAWERIDMAFTLGAWHLIQATYDGTTLKAFLDGVAGTIAPVTSGFGGISLSGNHLRLGDGTLGSPLLGSIADVELSDTVLSAGDLSQIKSWCTFNYGVP